MPSVQDRLRCVKMRERFFVYALPRSRVARRRLPHMRHVPVPFAARRRGPRRARTKIKKVIISEFSRHV